MPTIRYEIRNEYGLADPELHRAADKDDPEAVLEGVAMAGLVGVLRQLGDLAEFATEIFHDLHEEVMSTAARGHGLMLRVQQLEAEFPSLEKAFFSQSTHSTFTYNDGTDWHANIQINRNLVTQGDMPRFILDSYEECRGPPRLFMLDKFDIAGAGACLKRYSDPSFFKTELASSSGMADVDIPREKRSRKMKKKGSRWKNGKTLEALLSPNGKESSLQLAALGQVLEKPATRLVHLKPRHLNSEKGRSLMGRLLELHSDMQKVVQDTSRSHLNGKLETFNLSEQDSVLHDIVMDKPISHPSPMDENALTSNHGTPILLPTYRLEYEKIENELLELPPKAAFGAEETEKDNFAEQSKILTDYEIKSGSSINHCELGDHEKGEISEMKNRVLYNSEINLESIGDGSRSDDIGSEQENFMDALNTMESEVETDSDSKNIQENFDREDNTIGYDSVEDLEELNTKFSEKQYVENSVHMNNNITHELSDSAKSDALSNMYKTKSTKEVFFTSNQDLDLAIDLGKSHDIINDDIWSKAEVPTSVNLNSNNVHDIELSDHSGLRSQPEEAPCSSFATELTSIPSLHPRKCSDELLSHAAVQNDISASCNKQPEGDTVVNGSHMNDQDLEVSVLAEHMNDLFSEIMTETVEMSTHLSQTCETSTEDYHSKCSLVSLSMPTEREMQESNDRESEASLSDGGILSATPFLDNRNAFAPHSGLVIAEIQNGLPLEYPLANTTSDDIGKTNDASNNILNLSLGTGVEHEDEDCFVEHHAEALVSGVMEISHKSLDHLPVFKDEVDEVSVGYNEDTSLPLTMRERESQEIVNEDTTIRSRVPDHLLDMKDEVNREVAPGCDEDLSLPLTMQEGELREALDEELAIRCGLPNQIQDIIDEDNKKVYLENDDLSSPLTMQERGSHEVLNEDIASRCNLSDHHPDMKHEDNGDISVGYCEDVALPLTMQERESQEACNEDRKTFSYVGLSTDLSTLSAIDTEIAIDEEKLSYIGSSSDIVHVDEMPVNNPAMFPVLAHFSDTKLQPSDRMNSEEESTSCADVQLHLGSNSSDLCGYPVLLDDNLGSEKKYTGYDSEKERKQIEQNFLSDEVSSGMVSAKDESHESAHLYPSSALSPDTSSSKKQLDEDCVSSPVISHLHELKVHETCNQKNTDPLDSQRIPDINNSSPEKQIEQNFLSDEVSSGIVFAKDESLESAHHDPSSGLSPDMSSSKKQLDENCVCSPVTSHLHELKIHEACNQRDIDPSDSQRIPDINSSSPEKPESSTADLDSNLFAEDISSDKTVALASCISYSQTESVSATKKSFQDDYSLERKHGDGARSLEQSPFEGIEEISSSIKSLPVNLHEEASKLEVRHEDNAPTALEEHPELEIVANSTGIDNRLPPSRSSNDDVDNCGSLDLPSLKGDTAKQVESDAFTSCTDDSENLSSSVISDPSMVVLPQFPSLNVMGNKSTMPIPDDSESDQSSACLTLPDVEEPPPLPPLPPIGWRTGKLHEKTLLLDEISVQHVPETCSLVPSSGTEYKVGLECGERVQPANQFANMTKTEEVSFEHGLLTTEGEHMLPSRLSQLPPILHGEMNEIDQFLLMPNVQYEKSLHDPNALSGLKLLPADQITPLALRNEVPQQVPSLQQEKVKSVDERTFQIEEVLPTTELERVQDSQHGYVNLDKELMHHQNLFVAQSNIENEAHHSSQGIFRGGNADMKSLEPQFTPVLDVCPPGYVVLVEQNPSNHYGVIWASGAEMPIVRPSSLRNRPRNPLIEAVAAHDRSTMRKVSELVRPPTNKSDERNSLLEQIRNRAFSLKPATSTNQNMKAPPTNLKVAAIIEKANAIRQACAGSDEDDDADSWSDS